MMFVVSFAVRYQRPKIDLPDGQDMGQLRDAIPRNKLDRREEGACEIGHRMLQIVARAKLYCLPDAEAQGDVKALNAPDGRTPVRLRRNRWRDPTLFYLRGIFLQYWGSILGARLGGALTKTCLISAEKFHVREPCGQLCRIWENVLLRDATGERGAVGELTYPTLTTHPIMAKEMG